MKYIAVVEGVEYAVEIDPDNRVFVNDELVEVDLKRIGQLPVYSLLINNASREVVAEELPGNDFRVIIGGDAMTVRVEDERWRRLRQAKGLDTAGGELALKAPIPGLVVKVLIADGEQVHTGQSLVILEAMKMENDLRAPRAATVGHVKVKPGDRVEQGQVLVTLQADA
jgi:biotin carboxyl carrier protein